jgi:hypothetical protein
MVWIDLYISTSLPVAPSSTKQKPPWLITAFCPRFFMSSTPPISIYVHFMPYDDD